MSLIPIDGNVQFVQSTTPSNPADGDVWVDTSLSPPQTKIYDDGATAFIQPRELSNLDAPVSGAGATQTDIETGVDNSTTGSTVATNLDAKVSEAGRGVDWSSKTLGYTTGSVSGAGYVVSVHDGGGGESTGDLGDTIDFSASVSLTIDGASSQTVLDTSVSIGSAPKGAAGAIVSATVLARFESSFSVSGGGATYLLD